jgi:hypothetical protein
MPRYLRSPRPPEVAAACRTLHRHLVQHGANAYSDAVRDAPNGPPRGVVFAFRGEPADMLTLLAAIAQALKDAGYTSPQGDPEPLLAAEPEGAQQS